MDKIISIHQPETFPYIGYFSKMSASHEFIILDNVQFKKNNFQNRNRILHCGAPKWLTLPVVMEGHMTSTIRDMKIADTVDWRSRTIKALYDAYCDCDYFNDHILDLVDIIRASNNSLLDFNMSIINYIRDFLDIDTPLIYASDMQTSSHKSDLVLDICKERRAQVYISGKGGRDYLDSKKFSDEGIIVAYQEYDTSISYNQRGTDTFIPYMSTIDLLMNNSKEDSKSYLIMSCNYDS